MKHKELYLGGGGLAGSAMILNFGKFIIDQGNDDLNLKGIFYQGGWISPFYQYQSFIDYSLEHSIIQGGTYVILEVLNELCMYILTLNIPFVSPALCQVSTQYIIGNPFYPTFDPNDIRNECSGKYISCEKESGLNFILNTYSARS